MICPTCGKQLCAVSLDSLTVDMCKDGGCGGIWFDHLELNQVDSPGEALGAQLVDLQNKEAKSPPEKNGARHCPRCPDIRLMQQFFSVKHEVVVDECPQCAGIWLDSGELEKIRKEYGTEEERESAARHYFANMFTDELSETVPAASHKAPFSNMGKLFQVFSRTKK